MKTKKVIYEGLIVAGIAVLATAHFMGFCVNGLCTQEWLIRNLVLGTGIELFAFVYIHKHIKEGGLTLYHETGNLDVVINHYRKVRLCAIIGIFYVIIFVMFPNTRTLEAIKGTYLTAVVLLIFALSVMFSTTSDIARIKNRRLWNELMYVKSRWFSSRFFKK